MSTHRHIVLPPNPFIANEKPIKKPDLSRFIVQENYLIEGLQHYENQQTLRDGFGWRACLCADIGQPAPPFEQIHLALLKEADEPFTPTQNTPTDEDHRTIAVIDCTRDNISNKERIYRFRNARNWSIQVQLNREHSATSLMDWFEKVGVPQLREAFRQMAHTDMRGEIAYTEAEVKSRWPCFAKTPEALKAFCDKTTNWERDTITNNKANQRASDRVLRSRLLGLAYYRYRQAGYKWREYARDAASIGLEHNVTEKTSAKRLEVAAKRQAELWHLEFNICKPDIANGINFISPRLTV